MPDPTTTNRLLNEILQEVRNLPKEHAPDYSQKFNDLQSEMGQVGASSADSAKSLDLIADLVKGVLAVQLKPTVQKFITGVNDFTVKMASGLGRFIDKLREVRPPLGLSKALSTPARPSSLDQAIPGLADEIKNATTGRHSTALPEPTLTAPAELMTSLEKLSEVITKLTATIQGGLDLQKAEVKTAAAGSRTPPSGVHPIFKPRLHKPPATRFDPATEAAQMAPEPYEIDEGGLPDTPAEIRRKLKKRGGVLRFRYQMDQLQKEMKRVLNEEMRDVERGEDWEHGPAVEKYLSTLKKMLAQVQKRLQKAMAPLDPGALRRLLETVQQRSFGGPEDADIGLTGRTPKAPSARDILHGAARWTPRGFVNAGFDPNRPPDTAFQSIPLVRRAGGPQSVRGGPPPVPPGPHLGAPPPPPGGFGFDAAKTLGGTLGGILGKLAGTFLKLEENVVASMSALLAFAEVSKRFVNLLNPAIVQQFDLAMRDLGATIGNAFAPMLEEATIFVRQLADAIAPLMHALGGFFQAIFKIAEALLPIVEVLASINSIFMNILAPILNVFAEILKVLLSPLKLLARFLEIVAKAFGAIFRVFEKILGPALEAFGKLLELILKPLEILLDILESIFGREERSTAVQPGARTGDVRSVVRDLQAAAFGAGGNLNGVAQTNNLLTLIHGTLGQMLGMMNPARLLGAGASNPLGMATAPLSFIFNGILGR